MKWLFSILILLSVVFGLLNGRIAEVSQAAMEQAAAAVKLSFALLGSICLWSGIMEVAAKSGLTERIAKLLTPLMRLLFRDVSSKKARNAICMNITANLLGLGNAATPLGIEAMQELSKEGDGKTATDPMIIFTVLNTCSLQLIPTTAAALRLSYGSKSPMEILPAVLLTSLCALTAALFAVFLCKRVSRFYYKRVRKATALRKNHI